MINTIHLQTMDKYNFNKHVKMETRKETYYIEFLNSKNNFRIERKDFETYEEAKQFLISEFEKFNLDMIRIEFN